MVTVLLTLNSMKWLIFMCELQNKYLTQNTVKVSVHTGRTLQSVAVNHQLLEKRELWPKVENKDHRFVGISLFLLNPLHFSADQLPPSSRSSIQNITVEPLQLSRDDPFKVRNNYYPVTNCNQPIHANTNTCNCQMQKHLSSITFQHWGTRTWRITITFLGYNQWQWRHWHNIPI